MPGLDWLNSLDAKAAHEAFLKCCGSSRWATRMAESRPFASASDLHRSAETFWNELTADDRQEAFRSHPRIGDLTALKKRFASTANWAGEEQAQVSLATDKTLEALQLGNATYEKKFGRIFLVCATGKSAEEMLSLLNARLGNNAEQELSITSVEQSKITRIRLEKLLK